MAGDSIHDRQDVIVAHPEIRGGMTRVSLRDYKEEVHGPVLPMEEVTRDGTGKLLDHIEDEKAEEKILSKSKVWGKVKAPEAPKDGLDDLTVEQLQEKADELGLDTKGKKAELIERIRAELKETE